MTMWNRLVSRVEKLVPFPAWWRRHKTGMPHILTVDIVGTCNLRCPSCPVGNMGPVNESGLMSEELFRKIVTKAIDECGIRSVMLFNWTESLLHPRLPDFVRFVKARQLYCMLSSNLNVVHDIDALLRARPDHIRISLSGFTQDVYGRTHRRGDIERVKDNMRRLSAAWKRLKARSTRIVVYYHKYRHNLHEIEPMRRLATELGFEFEDAWAYYMPLEKLMRLLDGGLPETERRFVEETFALPIVESVEAAKAMGPGHRCDLLEDQLVVNVRGELALCCTVYDMADGPNKLGHYLDMTPADISGRKRGHPTCADCGRHNLHLHYGYYNQPTLRKVYDELAVRNIAAPPP